MYGRKYMGVLRTTFIIDEQGIIERVITKVNTKNAAEQILKKWIKIQLRNLETQKLRNLETQKLRNSET